MGLSTCCGTEGGFAPLDPVGVMKKLVKLVDELLAEMMGVLDIERPRTGELGKVKLFVGEFGLLFFNFCCT